MASFNQGHIMDGLGNDTNEHKEDKCHLVSAPLVDTDGNKWPC
jgi:hypothetical protein